MGGLRNFMKTRWNPHALDLSRPSSNKLDCRQSCTTNKHISRKFPLLTAKVTKRQQTRVNYR